MEWHRAYYHEEDEVKKPYWIIRHNRRHLKKGVKKMKLPFGLTFTWTWHDTKVVAFHAVVAVAQLVLIQAKLENPYLAGPIQTALEFLRRLAV